MLGSACLYWAAQDPVLDKSVEENCVQTLGQCPLLQEGVYLVEGTAVGRRGVVEMPIIARRGVVD